MSGLTQLEHGTRPSNFTAQDKPTWELYSTCIHCGLCLNHCPTYRVLGAEMDSPRGRIYQILQVDEGRLPIGESFVTHIDRCLGCVACETACPSGVKYGQIVERARAQIEQQYPRPWHQRVARKFFFGALKDYGKLTRIARVMRFYQRSGMQWLARHTGVLWLLGLARVERLSPTISNEFSFAKIGTVVAAVGERRARVAFHIGCVGSVAFAGLNDATIRVLTKNGVEVHIFADQRCCGALHAHSGYLEDARELARANVQAMQKAGVFGTIITNSAGCGSHMKHYAELLEHDAELGPAAHAFAANTRDVTEFLAALGLRDPKSRIEQAVTYQDPCHLAHAQKIRSAPRQLLGHVGARLVEMAHSDQCCGSAGSYNVTQNQLSMQILDAKMQDVREVGPAISAIVTANTGCMLQLRAGVEREGLKLQVKHVIEVLDECY
jgi:glycolate oxidase iron-sulfur subunit